MSHVPSTRKLASEFILFHKYQMSTVLIIYPYDYEIPQVILGFDMHVVKLSRRLKEIHAQARLE
jgi:hypothetical protein